MIDSIMKPKKYADIRRGDPVRSPVITIINIENIDGFSPKNTAQRRRHRSISGLENTAQTEILRAVKKL
jgi:hypothetical protein